MNNTFDFSAFSRQSSKGILVNYFQVLVKVLKSSWVILLILLAKRPSELTSTKIVLAVGALLVFILIRAILVYLNFKFKIKDNNFILKQGILKKSNTLIPFEKIQNINFKQNFIQQLINVTQVEIETAGAKKVEISIKALSREKAAALKSVILDKIHVNTHQTVEDVKKTQLQKISFLELLKVSLSENHFRSFFIMVGFVFSIYFQIKDFLEQLEIENKFDSIIDDKASTLFNDILFILLLFGFSFIASVVFSMIFTFLKHFDLTVSLQNSTLEVQQGLLTKKNNILKKQKVQNIRVSTNPVKKYLGIYNVVFRQAVSGKVKTNKLIRVVGSEERHIEIFKKILFKNSNLESSKKHLPDRYYITQMLFRSSIFVLLLNVFFVLVIPSNSIFFINIFLVPAIVFLVLLRFKKSYYKLNEEMLEKGSGLVGTTTAYFEFFKLQKIKMKQTIFQKRKGVANLVLQTASGKITIPCMPKNEAVAVLNYILYKTEISKEPWM